jgi:hypothetical protein
MSKPVIPPESAKADDVTTALTDQSLVEQTPEINKSVLMLPEPRRIRDRDHIRYVIKQLGSSSSAFCAISCARSQGER